MRQETMTSRERVLCAINHKQPDRVPIDLGAHFSTGISAPAYIRLRRLLGMDTEKVEMIDCVQGLARVDWDVIERFHIDTVLLNPPWPQPYRWNLREYPVWVPRTFQPEKQPDGGYRLRYQGKELYMPAGGYFFDGGWPDFYGLEAGEKLRLFARRARELYEQTDKFTIMMGFSAYFGGLEFACDMLTDPERCMERNEKALAENIARFDEVNRLMGPYIGAVELNGDLGIQSGPMCTPASFVRCCLPYLKRFCSHVHNTSGIKLFLHSCGSIAPLIPYLIEAEVDILNPVQISAANMDPQMLKRAYGDRICFWGGGCNTQHVLPNGTPGEVAANTRELVQAFKPGGGFVFNQVHNILGNVPAENIVAMLDTAYENAWYGEPLADAR